MVQRANPYDGVAILRLEHSVGFSSKLPALIMRNAPPSLLLVLPLGFLGVRAASLLWSLLMLASLWVSVRMIAAMHHQTGNRLNLLAYSFAPAISCLIAGQMGLFVLLGVALFLRLQQTRPFLAGASLWLCALKPHLFLPFGVVLLAWIVLTRRYRIVAGAAAAFAFSTAVAMALDPAVWAHYAHMMHAAQLGDQLIPCVSTMLRIAINPNAVWIQSAPAGLGCLWAFWYFLRHRDWNWLEHGSLLLLVSVAVAPYSWFMDQAALLPAILHGLYRNRSRGMVAVLAMLSAIVELANIRGVPLGNRLLYPWTAPVWLAWYLFALRRAVPDGLTQEVAEGVTSVAEDA
jgi:hypothetical protein